MGARFSLVIPTRHRPRFVAQALAFISRQAYADYEVIVSDNYTDETRSCRAVVEQSGAANVRYVRPQSPVGMVENWTFASQFPTGDYVLYFTDKMFLLPDTLSRAARCLEQVDADIVNWVDDSYSPFDFADYFGAGAYNVATGAVPPGQDFSEFDPAAELSAKGRAGISRLEQGRSSYVRGKICFGAYKAEFVRLLVCKYGKLFHNIAPDYTSMILGLSEARRAIECQGSGIVHINTDISNGVLTATNDAWARQFLADLGDVDTLSSNLLVPGLYTSSHNLVAHDYLTLRRRFDLSFEFSAENWLVYIAEDVASTDRVWSSTRIRNEQTDLLRAYIEGLEPAARSAFDKKLTMRGSRSRSPSATARRWLRAALPPQKRQRLQQVRDWVLGRNATIVTTSLDMAVAERAVSAQRGGRVRA
jgi:glycosyltransferase involved in cell wall biosynthesis